MNPAPITAVICTRDRGAVVAVAAASVLANRHPHLRLLVVDQSKDDSSGRALEPFKSDARFLYVKSHTIGASRARNEGLHLADTEIVAFTDDDCEVPENWLTELQQVFTERPDVALTYCNVRAAPHDPSAGFVPDFECRGTRVYSGFSENLRGMGAGLAVRRGAMLELGGFDEELGPGARFPACEDRDLGTRAILSGKLVCVTDRTYVVHHGFRSWEGGKALTKRDWVGIGAACAKPLRAGKWSFASVTAYELFVKAIAPLLNDVVHLRRPRGAARALHFLNGFAKGWTAPFDRDRLMFGTEDGRTGDVRGQAGER